MIDLIVRDCGYGEWLPIITETATGKELYRGSRLSSPEKALEKARSVWDNAETGNVAEFKKAHGLS